jgi:hypothetical protein
MVGLKDVERKEQDDVSSTPGKAEAINCSNGSRRLGDKYGVFEFGSLQQGFLLNNFLHRTSIIKQRQ